MLPMLPFIEKHIIKNTEDYIAFFTQSTVMYLHTHKTNPNIAFKEKRSGQNRRHSFCNIVPSLIPLEPNPFATFEPQRCS
jgi:hypothetical protein